MDPAAADLRAVYLDALQACSPAALVGRKLRASGLPEGPVDFLAVGKCAEELARGVLDSHGARRGLILIPRGYSRLAQLPEGVSRVEGTHPWVSEASVRAAHAAIEFARDAGGPILALVSGGASACVEAPLEPWFSLEHVVAINERLVKSGLDIEAINTVRKHLSAVKGGRLGALLPTGSLALVLSDVDRGRLDLVGSGLVVPDTSSNQDAAELLESLGDDVCRRVAETLRSGDVPETVKTTPVETHLIADNGTLVAAACRLVEARGGKAVRVEEEIVGDVEDAAARLMDRARFLRAGEVLVAGGEPTVVVRGNGRGGRCSELAVRFARLAGSSMIALFGSSDGVDGMSPAAAVLVTHGLPSSDPAVLAEVEQTLGRSASYDLVSRIGEAIMLEPTGNNLRDLFLIARRGD
jgi:glycerate-2-kinase